MQNPIFNENGVESTHSDRKLTPREEFRRTVSDLGSRHVNTKQVREAFAVRAGDLAGSPLCELRMLASLIEEFTRYTQSNSVSFGDFNRKCGQRSYNWFT